MRPRILEREFEIAQLGEAAREAAAGRGCVVLVSGEAPVRRLAGDAGFSRFRRVAETPFNLVYEARP